MQCIGPAIIELRMCNYLEVFSIMNIGFSINRDTKMAALINNV